MYYIEQEENELVKYEVEINESELKLLIHKIVTECGIKIHHSYNSTGFPKYYDYTHIRNYKHEQVGKTERYEDIYHIEYDEYKDPKLVTLINKLLNGETNVILELKNPIPEEEKNQELEILNQIKKLNEEMEMADQSSIIYLTNKLMNLSEELKKSQQIKQLNKNKKSDLVYYQQVLSYIELKEVSRISIDTIEKFNYLYEEITPFFITTRTKNINQNVNKELYKKIVIE